MKHSKPVRLKTAPTGPDKSGSKPRGENVYLFLEFTIDGTDDTEKTGKRDGKKKLCVLVP